MLLDLLIGCQLAEADHASKELADRATEDALHLMRLVDDDEAERAEPLASAL